MSSSSTLLARQYVKLIGDLHDIAPRLDFPRRLGTYPSGATRWHPREEVSTAGSYRRPSKRPPTHTESFGKKVTPSRMHTSCCAMQSTCAIVKGAPG